jgi:hypothetical protein
MRRLYCPVCYSLLEVCEVTPCVICGSWPESVAKFEPSAKFTEFRLAAGKPFVLCQGCELEEFMVPGGWGYRLVPDEKLPHNALQWVKNVESPQLGQDKRCPSCQLRLAFLEVVVATR